MSRITKHFRKLKLTFVASIGFVVVGIATVYPWFDIEEKNDSYYVVELDGKVMGTVETLCFILHIFSTFFCSISTILACLVLELFCLG